jgi:glutathione S-transferase
VHEGEMTLCHTQVPGGRPVNRALRDAAMSERPKLTYFDAPVSRGEECRLALHIAGVDFEDVRVNQKQWAELKPNTPFGGLPTFEIPGKLLIGQCNAILTLIGRKHGLHPEDLFEAARHEAMMCHVEDLRGNVGPTLRIQDPEEKKKVREDLAKNYIPTWGERVERQLGDGPFFGGAKLNVVDIKLFVAVRWFANGTVDHVPATVFSGLPKLTRLFESVRDSEGVKSWYAKKA